MMIIPVRWSFQRKSIMPIIEAKGESEAKDSECFLIQNAIEIIEKASEFNRKPYSNKPSFPSTSNFAVLFSLIFPSEVDLANFMKFLEKKI